MKVFWRPSKISTAALVGIALGSVGVFNWVEQSSRVDSPAPSELKLRAIQRTAEAYRLLTAHHNLSHAHPNHGLPADFSSLLGAQHSIITSDLGNLDAKKASLNPNWAKVIIDLFEQAGLKAGDTVGVGVSGSFPALNVATLVAAQEMGLKTQVISSGAASNWGANEPDWTWLDMESLLFKKGYIGSKSIIASQGAKMDLALDLSQDGKAALEQARLRNQIKKLPGATLDELTLNRVNILSQTPIRAYVNVGGGVASVGTRVVKKTFPAGITLPGKISLDNTAPGVMSHFYHQGTPVIHLVRIRELAAQIGLRPWTEGAELQSTHVDRKLAILGLIAILLSLIGVGFIKIENPIEAARYPLGVQQTVWSKRAAAFALSLMHFLRNLS